jgi:16S rRNA (cytosine967-C5)-methyltransferase
MACSWRTPCRCTSCRVLTPGRWFRCRTPPPSSPRRCCWAACLQGRRGRYILDACAAPGGKTAHLLELCDAEVLALDIDAQRCERIRQTLARLQLGAQVVAGDAAQPDSWWDGRLFDAILLDAPCTASGIVRRHPDVAWLRRETDVAQLAASRRACCACCGRCSARRAAAVLHLFGVRGRGRGQIETFLAHNTDARLQPSPGHLLPHLPANGGGVPDNPQGDHDGFFYALLEKRPG